MSSKATSIVTSTPKARATVNNILRENFFDFSVIKREKSAGKFKRPLSVKKNRVTKENFNRSKHLSKHDTSEDQSEKRRKQALEAMKISENRRQRMLNTGMVEDDSISDSMASMSIDKVDFLPDGRLKLSRKELAARHDKHRRIKEFLAEQNARKAVEAAKKKKNRSVTFKSPTFRWTPRPAFKSSPRHAYNLKSCRRSLMKTETFTDEEKVEAVPAEVSATIPAEVKAETQEPTAVKSETHDILRYTNDQLREMNPYGYFFL